MPHTLVRYLSTSVCVNFLFYFLFHVKNFLTTYSFFNLSMCNFSKKQFTNFLNPPIKKILCLITYNSLCTPNKTNFFTRQKIKSLVKYLPSTRSSYTSNNPTTIPPPNPPIKPPHVTTHTYQRDNAQKNYRTLLHYPTFYYNSHCSI